MKTKTKIFAWLAVLLMLGAIAAYAVEFQVLENTFDAGSLIFRSVAAGLLAGFLLGSYLRKYGKDTDSSLQIWVACLLLPAIFGPLAGSLSNRLLSPNEIQSQSFEFWEEKAYAADRFGFIEGEKIEPDGYYIFVLKNGEIKRIDSKIRRFQDVKKGEMVKLPVKKGLWGFEVVQFE